MARVLAVDDDEDLRRLLALRLRSARHEVMVAASGEEALAVLHEFVADVVVTDLRMPGMEGMALYEQLRRRSPTLPVIILTAHGTIPDAIDATRKGVFAYLTKPFDGAALLACVNNAVHLSGDPHEGDSDGWRRSIISRSAAMDEVLRTARRVASSEASVLIQGQSGTGKELLAQAIHQASPRAAGPFVAVNCAAMPENLLESELFGHARGAFTGATTAGVGLLVSADGGTLFLDEIGDMSLAFQAKLLRALQEREVRPVGATHTVAIDVRVVSASHRDLESAVADNAFRDDLLYRLNVVTLTLPPLEARREDIPLLAHAFLERLAERSPHPSMSIAPDALEALVGAHWPGNVRQLHNVMEHCVALAPAAILTADLVATALRGRAAALPTLDEVRLDAERDYLVRVLQVTNGNVSQAARLSGRNRTDFYKLLHRHHLTPATFREDDG